MNTIRVYDLLRRRVLVTRDSARQLGSALEQFAAPVGEPCSISVDFENIDAMTPSFVDEMLGVIDRVISTPGQPVQLVFLHAPTRLSEKFLAIARARNVRIAEIDDNTWSITQASA